MKKISADYIFTLDGPPRTNAVVILDSDGTILDVADRLPFEEVEMHEGIIVPGFVNAHCHLELSHLFEQIDRGTGLIPFIQNVQKKRKQDKEVIQDAIERAEREMIEHGIVAVADICNTQDTIPQKLKGNLHYHNFIEVFGFRPSRSPLLYEQSKDLATRFERKDLHHTITPHAPYSTSPDLLHTIIKGNSKDELLSIHMQESPEENLFFQNKKGKFVKFYDDLGVNIEHFHATGESSLQSILHHFEINKPVLFVHNTFTSPEDLFVARNYSNKIHWCLCPNANQFIERTLPPVSLFYKSNQKVCIGTDSLAGNVRLSVFHEMRTIANHLPEYDLNKLLYWACLNGAEMLGISKKYGSIEKGKRPGLNLITDVELPSLKLTNHSRVQKLI